jgi:hypothetical protein
LQLRQPLTPLSALRVHLYCQGCHCDCTPTASSRKASVAAMLAKYVSTRQLLEGPRNYHLDDSVHSQLLTCLCCILCNRLGDNDAANVRSELQIMHHLAGASTSAAR